MAKKKQLSRFVFLTSPFSPKTACIVFSVITGFLVINITSFQKFQRDERTQATLATKSLLTKVNLRNVLGNTTDTDIPSSDETQFKKKPEVRYWYDVLSQKPNYRDAYIILATLAYNDHRCQLAQTHLTEAYSLDPNMPKNTNLAQAIEKCGKQ
jgi:hypothetical protein